MKIGRSICSRVISMALAPVGQLEARLEGVQQIVAGDQAANGMELRFVAERRDEDPVGPQKSSLPGIVEPRSRTASCGERVGIECSIRQDHWFSLRARTRRWTGPQMDNAIPRVSVGSSGHVRAYRPRRSSHHELTREMCRAAGGEEESEIGDVLGVRCGGSAATRR